MNGAAVRFTFRGKSGRRHDVTVRDRRLARVVARCQELPGQELLQYVEADGTTRAVRSEDVNAYLREAAGADVTAKDFRTWAGTVLVFRALREAEAGKGDASDRRAVVEAVRRAAGRLGNTPAVARRSYVHPAVPEAFLRGALPGPRDARVASPQEEAELAALLRRELARDADRSRDRPRSRRSGVGRRT